MWRAFSPLLPQPRAAHRCSSSLGPLELILHLWKERIGLKALIPWARRAGASHVELWRGVGEVRRAYEGEQWPRGAHSYRKRLSRVCGIRCTSVRGRLKAHGQRIIFSLSIVYNMAARSLQCNRTRDDVDNEATPNWRGPSRTIFAP